MYKYINILQYNYAIFIFNVPMKATKYALMICVLQNTVYS